MNSSASAHQPQQPKRLLRAPRYANRTNRQLAGYITDILPYLDFGETERFYDKVFPKMDDTTRALLGCNDRYFLLRHLLRRPDSAHPWIFDRCREVEESPDAHLDLWARYHYKSTIITFAGIIQELLIDPEITIAIFSHTKPIATAFLDQIKLELEQNEELKKVYSDALFERPERESARWSKETGIIIKRKGNPRESTVEAWGLVDAQPTSRHYMLLVYDDVITEKSVTNPEMIKKTTQSWELSDNLGSHLGTRKWTVGTRYNFGDTYGIMLDRKVLRPRIYPATDDGTLHGKPVLLTQQRWDEVKKSQRSTISAQMLLNPVAGTEAVFLTEWFRPYEIIPSTLNVYIMCDPSKGRNKSSDRTAIAVIGIDPAGNKYLLDGVRHRMRLSDRYDFLKRYYYYWLNYPGVQAIRVGYEVYGAQADTEVIAEYQQRDNLYFEIVELNYPRQGPHSKKARVERLEPDLKSGRFYLPGMVWNPDPYMAKRSASDSNICLWSVWSEKDQKAAEQAKKNYGYSVGQILYRRLMKATKMQRWCEANEQIHRIVRPLKRLDEDGDVYDLTRAFMEEARFFPAAPHDDLIDVISRLYDMEPAKPAQYDQKATDPLVPDDDLGTFVYEASDNLEVQ